MTSRRKTSVLIAVAVATGFGTAVFFFRQGELNRNGIRSLVDASATLRVRPFDGRLTGGFAWAPSEKPSRAGTTVTDEPSWSIAAAGSSLPPNDHHSRGAAFLLMGDFDKAVASLEESVRSTPEEASIWSDLSAAYDARGKAHDYMPDRAASLDAAEHAWRLTHTPEASWNRAVTLSSLHIDGAAARAWDDFLALETDPSWRHEGQERRAKVTGSSGTESVTESPAQTFEHFETVVLPQWARAQLKNNHDVATRELQTARRLADALARTGEQLPAAEVAAIDRVCHTASERCTAAAAVRLAYDESVRSMEGQGYGAAMTPLRECIHSFEASGSPYAIAARFQIAVCMVHENRFAEARRALSHIHAELAGLHYRTLEAHVKMVEGLTTLHDARPEESIAFYTAARDLFKEGRDIRSLAAIETRLADACEFSGDRDEAMAHRVAAFDAMSTSGDTSELYLALFESGTSLERQRLRYAADGLLTEAVREALATHHHVVAAIASLWRSTIASSLGDFVSAGEQAKLAARYTSQTADAGQRALLAATERQLGTPSTAERDVESGITEAIQFFREAGNRAWLPQLLRQRALAERSRSDTPAAEHDLREAVDISEEVLDEMAPATMREGFEVDVRSTYEDLICFLLDRGASQEALLYAERARLIGQGRRTSQDVLRSLSLIPPLTSVAVLEVQIDGLVVWLASRGSIQTFRSHDPNLAARVAGLTRTPPSEEALEQLYDLLARSWISNVPTRYRLVISPPPVLADVPFAALTDRYSRHALLDRYVVEIGQSLSSAIDPSVKVEQSDRAVIVGDPAYHDMPRLPHTRSEAVTIGGLYPHSTLLLERNATPQSVLSAIASAEIFHFGGHAAVNDLAPELSSLILSAGDDMHDSRLYLHELAERKMPMKLVVLSACNTAARPHASRRTLSLSRAFVQAGARTVVGTLWPVPDEGASAFSTRLHESLNRGKTVAEAVREAQLDMKARRNSDLTWAAFCVLTAHARRGGAGND